MKRKIVLSNSERNRIRYLMDDGDKLLAEIEDILLDDMDVESLKEKINKNFELLTMANNEDKPEDYKNQLGITIRALMYILSCIEFLR